MIGRGGRAAPNPPRLRRRRRVTPANARRLQPLEDGAARCKELQREPVRFVFGIQYTQLIDIAHGRPLEQMNVHLDGDAL